MTLRLLLSGRPHELDIEARKPRLRVKLDGLAHELIDHGARNGVRRIEIDGQEIDYIEARDGNITHLRLGGRTVTVTLIDPRDASQDVTGGEDAIRAPMPGVVVTVLKAAGDEVKRGETVLTIESMKLQTNLVAPRDGIVAEILKFENANFDKDDVVFRLEALKDETTDA